MMEFTFRHLRGHWRLNLVVLLCLTLTSALVAGLSGYAAAISARELNQRLEKASPAERSLLITGSLYTFGDELYEDLQARLGKLLKDRMVIRYSELPVDLQLSSPATSQKPVVARLDVYSFDPLAGNARLVEGKLPEQVSINQARGNWLPPVEAVIGARAAEQSGYGIGDRLITSDLYRRLDIVGIVEPRNPHDDLWGGDLSAFVIATGTRDALPLIIAPESMQSYLGEPVFPHELSWRVTLAVQRIDPATAEALHSNLINFQTQFATRGAQTDTGLQQILADFLARLTRLRMALWLLTAQSLILVLYTLTMVTSFGVDRLHGEVATLSARGIGAWQITRVFALEALLLALPAALLLGPGLAQVIVHLWGKSTGLALPLRSLSGEMWRLSAIAAGVGWLAWVVPIFLAARRCSRKPLPARAQPPLPWLLHKRYVDLYLLVFGGLLAWQLNQSGSSLVRAAVGSRLGSIPGADRLFLLGPFLLLIALAMIFLRGVPFLLRLAARLVQHRPGWVLALGFLRPARNPLQASRVALLVSLTTGLVLFAHIFGDSLAHSQAALQPDALVQGIAAGFQLNALMLASFSVIAFFLAQWVAGEGRGRESGILRAMGLSARQGPILSSVEGSLVLLLGLLAGTVAGLGLSYMMIPYLSLSLVEPLAGVTIERVVVDWPLVARSYAVLMAVYGLALALGGVVEGRGQARRVAWREDE